MRRLTLLSVLTALLLLLPILGAAEDVEPSANGDAGMAQQILQSGQALKDERLVDLEAEYAIELNSLLSQIQAETDPMVRESLQKNAEAIKMNRELDLKMIMLEIALESGDENRIRQCEADLSALYEQGAAKPASGEPVQQPETGKISVPPKNPDDA